NDFWSSVLAGAEMAAKENNVRLEINSPTDEMHIDEQNQLIYEAIEERPDVIAVSPSSKNENNKALLAVKTAGIKLIYIDSKTDEEIQDVCVSTDNVAAGKKMAEPMLGTIDQTSKIAIVSHVRNSSTAEEREIGFREGLGSYESQIVDVVYSNSMKDIGYQVTKELLTKEPDISYLACLNEDSAVGAAGAVKELGLVGKICIVGFDNSTEEILSLEEGVFSAIVVQKAFSMGYLGIESAAELARGEKVETYIDSGSVLITKENMYKEENQELLFPFY
ncbi:MAG TPA: substrate-binding domain-containing protein, partial [Lachnospiraceae bacterium]|nr:substrate-binding domain-containing protein [Lachnospiraceae bacterium]